jgi:serine/threonine protein kinase
MNRARLQTIEEIFHSALDYRPGRLDHFLESACKGDGPLRSEVETLLASYRRAENFIETPALGLATKILETARPDLLLGQRMGHYELIRRIGGGGMGDVYLAIDVIAERKAALKILPIRFTGDAQRLKRFKQEARAVLALNHPNILTIYEIGQARSTHYIASELIEDETLRQRLTRGSLGVDEAVDITIQVSSALAAAHEAGIIHRDIKPENIMLRPDGYVKVLDFGIAKLAEKEMPAATAQKDAALAGENRVNSIVGTACYMSPEQSRGSPLDERSDIWSLGVVLYEMLTGRRPFGGNSLRETFASILAKETPPVRNSTRELN